VFILAGIERAVLASEVRSVLFAGAIVSLAGWIREIHERDHAAAGASRLRSADLR
jgi:hypothetical protein